MQLTTSSGTIMDYLLSTFEHKLRNENLRSLHRIHPSFNPYKRDTNNHSNGDSGPGKYLPDEFTLVGSEDNSADEEVFEGKNAYFRAILLYTKTTRLAPLTCTSLSLLCLIFYGQRGPTERCPHKRADEEEGRAEATRERRPATTGEGDGDGEGEGEASSRKELKAWFWIVREERSESSL